MMKYPRTSPVERKKKETRRLIFFVTLVVLVLGFSIYAIKHYDLKRKDVFSSVSLVKKVITPEPKKNYEDLTQRINAIIAQYPKTEISVAFTDPDTDQIYTYGKADSFVAASTAKVLVAVDFLQQVEAGKYSLNQKINGVDARWQLRQMIQQSNNDSWMAFNSLMGYQQENNYAKSIGITSYDSIDNTVKVSDWVLLLNKLYKMELLNDEHRSLLFYYMQNTNNEKLIPAGLSDTTVIHKYGALYGNLHDIAIVDGEHPFILGIFTNGSTGQDTRAQIFKDIGQAVRQFEEQ